MSNMPHERQAEALTTTSSSLADHLAAIIRVEQENTRLAFRTGIEHALRVALIVKSAFNCGFDRSRAIRM